MKKRKFYQCDEQSARSGDIVIEDYQGDLTIFNMWDSKDDGVVEVEENPFDGIITTLIIKAASEAHAEQLVGEYINEVSSFYCCDVEDAQNGDINIEVFRLGLIEGLFGSVLEDADEGVFEERVNLGVNPYYVIVASSEEHAEELVYEFLDE